MLLLPAWNKTNQLTAQLAGNQNKKSEGLHTWTNLMAELELELEELETSLNSEQLLMGTMRAFLRFQIG